MKKILFLASLALAFTNCSKSNDDDNHDIPAKDYELSEDGLTLKSWKNLDTKTIDMESDSKLQKVNTIGEYAFRQAAKLESIILPKNLKEIGTGAFYGANLKGGVTFNTSAKITIGEDAFKSTGITTLGLPNLTELSKGAFQGCSKLKEVKFGKITKIGEDAFRGRLSLTEINLDGTDLKEVGRAAFSGCEHIEKVTLPATLKKIDNMAFFACFVFQQLTMKATEVPTLVSANALDTGSKIKTNIFVPKGTENSYKTAENWSYYKDQILVKPEF